MGCRLFPDKIILLLLIFFRYCNNTTEYMGALLLLNVYLIYFYVNFVILFSPLELQHLNITTGFLSGIFHYTWRHFLARLSVLLKLF